MQKFFSYDRQAHVVEINIPEVLLVKEFAALSRADKTKDKSKLYRQIAYMQLALAWDSPYSQYDEASRKEEAMRDSGLSEKDLSSPEMEEAMAKYISIQESNKSIRLLNAAREAAEKFIDYFENVVNLRERDKAGRPVWNAEKVMKEMSMLNKVHQELVDLENRVKKELADTSQIRAGAVEGYEDYDD